MKNNIRRVLPLYGFYQSICKTVTRPFNLEKMGGGVESTLKFCIYVIYNLQW